VYFVFLCSFCLWEELFNMLLEIMKNSRMIRYKQQAVHVTFMCCNLVVQTEAAGDFEAKLTLFGEYLAIQRVRRLAHCINMTNFLTFLLGQSFKKVCGVCLQCISMHVLQCIPSHITAEAKHRLQH